MIIPQKMLLNSSNKPPFVLEKCFPRKKLSAGLLDMAINSEKST